MQKPFTFALTLFIAGTILLSPALAQQAPVTSQQSAAPATQQAPAPAATPKKAPAAKTAQTPAAKSPSLLTLKTPKDKLSYAIGLNIGKSMKKDGVDADPAIVLRGIKDAIAGGKTLLTDQEAQAALATLQSDLRKKQELLMQQTAEKNKTEGEAFLAANKTKEGVIALPSGLQYKILQQGSGPKPSATDSVVCNYRGTLLNGTEFDSSYKRGQPATFPVGQVIKGWTEALQLMSVGSKWQLFIPSDLAYGPRGAGRGIGPNSTLIFEVELLSIQGKTAPANAAKP